MTRVNDTDVKDTDDRSSDRSTVESASSVASLSMNYIMSRVSLAMTEAKVAAISLVLIAVIALFAVIILSGGWFLLCYGAAHFLIQSLALSLSAAVLAIVGCNALLLLILALCARNLVRSIVLSDTLPERSKTQNNE